MLTELLDSASVEVSRGGVVVEATVGPVHRRERLDAPTAEQAADVLDRLADALRDAADEVNDGA